jgi:hypothetical protein
MTMKRSSSENERRNTLRNIVMAGIKNHTFKRSGAGSPPRGGSSPRGNAKHTQHAHSKPLIVPENEFGDIYTEADLESMEHRRSEIAEEAMVDNEELELNCRSADMPPKTIFLTGHSSKNDCTCFLKHGLTNGRPYWESELEDFRVQWDTCKQTWQLLKQGISMGDAVAPPWVEVLHLPWDSPDPTMAPEGAWMEYATSRSTSRSSSDDANSPTEDFMRAKTVKGVSFVPLGLIIESKEEEEDSDAEEQDDQSEQEGEEHELVSSPNVKCMVVPLPPVKIFVKGMATSVDFTGIFTLVPDSINQKRPVYRAERIGYATPCEIRYAMKLKRWVISRIPLVKGVYCRLSEECKQGTTFVIAGVWYDAPNPVLANAPWEIRQGEDWKIDGVVCVQEVREPPAQICVFGASTKFDAVSGTYDLISNVRAERPVYQMAGTDWVVRYNKESQRWIIDVRENSGPSGSFIVKCNVPNPVETLHVEWQNLQEERNHKDVNSLETTLGCYKGPVPPKQVYLKGGYRGISGVYTICYRALFNDRFTYRKGILGWHMWWSENLQQWTVGNIPGRGGLDHIRDKGGDDKNFNEAWCTQDICYPHECTEWRYKGKLFSTHGHEDTNKGIVTCAQAAISLGDVPMEVEPVLQPPNALYVTRTEATVMCGVYFLHPELKNGRCAFEKQCNSRQSEKWAIFYQPSSSKWYIDRNGFEIINRAQAYVNCDCPDPSLAIGQWNASGKGRDAGEYSSSRGLKVHKVPEAPARILLFGAVSGNEDDDDSGMPMVLPFNGLYVIQSNPHAKRPFYRKEIDKKYIVRFFTGEQRWIVDSRPPDKEFPDTVHDDGIGLCAAVADCWHPVAVTSVWSVWHRIKKKEKGLGKNRKQFRRKSDGGRPLDAPTIQVNHTPLSASKLASLAKPEPLSPKSFNSSNSRRNSQASANDDDSVKMGSEGSSMGQSVGGRSRVSAARSQARSHRSHGGRSFRSQMTSRTAKSRISVGGMSLAQSLRGGGIGARSAISYGYATSMKSGRSAGSQELDGIDGSPRQGRDFIPACDHWKDTLTIAVVPVGSEPKRLFIENVSPAEICGLYEILGNQNGRPAYRLVEENGEVKTALEAKEEEEDREEDTSDDETELLADKYNAHRFKGAQQVVRKLHNTSTFDFSRFGYALRWIPEKRHWTLAEYAWTTEVNYEYCPPQGDLILTGGCGAPVFVGEVTPRGAADRAGVLVGSELIMVGLDEGAFRHKDAVQLLQSLSSHVTLYFKVSGFLPEGINGEESQDLCILRYDTPYPSSVCLPWLVPFDDAFASTDLQVECRHIELPPSSVIVEGHRGRPKEAMGIYEVQPELKNGRPEYANGRWTITWNSTKGRWTIAPGEGAAFAQAQCFAPHPGVVPEHGGIWFVSKDIRRRGLRVLPHGPPLTTQEVVEIFHDSLDTVIMRADDPACIQDSEKGLEGRTRFDVQKVAELIREMNVLLKEARVHGLSKDMTRATATRSRMAGYLILEILLTQGESDEDTVSRASWMEILVEVRSLLRNEKASTQVAFDDGYTAAHVVARYAFSEAWAYEALAELQRYGANLSAEDDLGLTPLLVAIKHQRFETVRAFLRVVCGEEYNLPIFGSQMNQADTDILNASMKANIGELRLLLNEPSRANVKITVQDDLGQGIVHHLVLQNHYGGLEAILRLNQDCHNIDIHMPDKHGDTPLHTAARMGAVNCIPVLLKYGASPTAMNDAGQTPYMLALVSRQETAAMEFLKSMVQWSEIESIIGKDRDESIFGSDNGTLVRSKVQKLLYLGFDDRFVSPLNMGDKQMDRLQLVNHLYVINPCYSEPTVKNANESEEDRQKRERNKLCCLELRGHLVAREILLPLLKLGGNAGLEVGDGVQYIDFLRYLLKCGFASFGGVMARRVLADSIDAMEERCRDTFDKLAPDMKVVTEALDVQIGRADSQQWKLLHHRYAHGPLSWLSVNGKTQDLLGAMSALVQAKTYDSVEGMLKDSLPAPNDFDKVTAPRMLSIVMMPFWNTVYSRWLVGWSANIADHLTKKCSTLGISFQLQELKQLSLPEVLSNKAKYTQTTREAFGEYRPKFARRSTIMSNRRLSSQLSMFSIPDDRRSISFSNTGSQPSIDERFRSSQLSTDERSPRMGSIDENVAVNNIIPKPKASQGEEGASPRVATTEESAALRREHVLEGGGVTDLVSGSIVVTDVTTLHEVVQEFKRMTLDEDGIELVGVYNEFWGEDDPKDSRSLQLIMIVAPPNAPALLAQVSLFLKRYHVISRHLLLFDDIETGAYSRVNTATRAYFNAVQRCQFAGCIRVREIHLYEWMTTDQLEAGGYLAIPHDAKLFKNSAESFGSAQNSRQHGLQTLLVDDHELIWDTSWTEILGNGTPLQQAPLERTVTASSSDEGPPMNKHELLNTLRAHLPKVAWDQLPHSQEVERLAKGLRNYEIRMFESPEGVLTAVQDYVVLHILDPDGDRVLVHLSPPSGYLQSLRKSYEPLVQTGKRIINDLLPKFLEEELNVHRFDISNGAWILLNRDRAATDIFPRAQRYFVMKASFVDQPDTFSLLRAGLSK